MTDGSPAIDVWLDGWQVHEDQLELSLHELIEWDTIPMDHAWIVRVFGDARTIPLQRDTYAALTHDPTDPSWQHVTGRVHSILKITLEYGPSTDPLEVGLIPVQGSAALEPVLWITQQRNYDRKVAGFVVTITRRSPRTCCGPSKPSQCSSPSD